MRIQSGNNASSLLCSAVYASPQVATRHLLWDYLDSLASSIDEPWLIARDFNSILDVLERAGGAAIARNGCVYFQKFVFNNDLRDLGCSGSRFTWSRGGLSQRLDRAIADSV